MHRAFQFSDAQREAEEIFGEAGKKEVLIE
jgi:hypothetical protein